MCHGRIATTIVRSSSEEGAGCLGKVEGSNNAVRVEKPMTHGRSEKDFFFFLYIFKLFFQRIARVVK